jgi:hypothetical protein
VLLAVIQLKVSVGYAIDRSACLSATPSTAPDRENQLPNGGVV